MSTESTPATTSKPEKVLRIAFDLMDLHDNPREFLGDIKGLANSLMMNRIRKPLSGYLQGGYYYVTDGKRRFKALEIVKAIDPNHPVLSDVPLILLDKNMDNKAITYDQIIKNDGLSFHPLELGKQIHMFVEGGDKHTEIAARLAFSVQYVRELDKIGGLPDNIKKLILNNTISVTYVRDMIKAKTLDKFIADYEAGQDLSTILEPGEAVEAEAVSTKTKQSKITKKDVEAVNSLKEFKRFMKQFSEVFKDPSKQIVYEFVQSLFNNELTFEDILNFFTDESTRETHDSPEKQATRAKAKKGTSANQDKKLKSEKAGKSKGKGKGAAAATGKDAVEGNTPKRGTSRKIGYIKPSGTEGEAVE